ncbi:tail sheath stabilizer and completion protein [bacterium]|nr:tail sheath stabilizer and completion protein [bacterium]
MSDTRQMHFYDEQIRRYILQFIRMFSGFSIKTGKKMNDGVSDYYIRVPARYGDISRMAATVVKGNSENIVNSTPFIACWVQSFQPDRSRVQEPFFSDSVSVNERQWDPVAGKYTNEQGNKYSVGRLMPVPYLLNMQVDVWTSNTDQKLQLLEQMLVLFNPALEIQQNDNPIDWTTITTVELTDIQWSSRGIPAGIEDQIDIASLFFQIPVWINPPAQVTRQNVIKNIIHNIYNYTDLDSLDYDPDAFEFFRDLKREASVIVTPGNYAINVTEQDGDILAKVYENGNWDNDTTWDTVLENYGTLHDGVSRMRLKYHGEVEDLNADVIATVTRTGDPTTLLLNIDNDTLPTNTVNSIIKVINPDISKPGFNGLDVATIGQRYLCLGDATSESDWGINISENDIIEYNGSEWVVSFDASEYALRAYVTNSYTQQQFKFDNGVWNDTYQGVYDSGYWRLELIQEAD